MSLTPEQLLIPRVMAIGTEPGTPNDTSGDFISGDILTQTEKRFDKWESKMLKHTVYLSIDFIEKFPHLFRPMPWYEGRKPEEMPQYLKHGENGKVRKVARYFNWATMIVEFEGGRTRRLTDKWIPCTEADFIQYQNSKK